MQREHVFLIAVAVAVILGGAGLAVVGAGYVADSVGYVQRLAAAPVSPTCSFCPYQRVEYVPGPDPRPVFLAYVLAMPMGIGTGYFVNREGRRIRRANARHGAIVREMGYVVAGAMIWMALFYVAAFVGISFGPANLGSSGPLYFVTLLIVPSLVMGAGSSILVEGISLHLMARTPAARG